MRVKVADFGLSRRFNLRDYYYRSSLGADAFLPLRWLAPEVITQGFKFTVKSDIFSFGVLVWELLDSSADDRPPFSGLTDEQLLLALCRGTSPIHEALPLCVPARLRALAPIVEGCLARSRKDRPQFAFISTATKPGRSVSLSPTMELDIGDESVTGAFYINSEQARYAIPMSGAGLTVESCM